MKVTSFNKPAAIATLDDLRAILGPYATARGLVASIGSGRFNANDLKVRLTFRVANPSADAAEIAVADNDRLCAKFGIVGRRPGQRLNMTIGGVATTVEFVRIKPQGRRTPCVVRDPGKDKLYRVPVSAVNAAPIVP